MPVQDAAANELSAGPSDLKQDGLSLRTDNRDLFQINHQALAIGRLTSLLPYLPELRYPGLDELTFKDQFPPALALNGCDL